MTALAAVLTVALAGLLVWRGARRGAHGLAPALGGLAVMLLFFRLAWALPDGFAVLAAAGLLAGAGATVGFKVALRRLERRARGSDESRSWHWARRADRAAGAALGLVIAALALLVAASAGTTVAFAVGANGGRSRAWVRALGKSCEALADISHFGLLAHIPRMGTYSREVRALIKILNAPPEKLKVLAEESGIAELADVPEIQQAVLDDECMALIERLGHGDVAALAKLVKSEATRRVVRCERVRRFVRGLTPSRLAAKLDKLPSIAPSDTLALSP